MGVETAFSQFPKLATRRLKLRQIEVSDAEALFAIKADPQVTAGYGQEPHHSLQDTLDWIRRLQCDYQQRNCLFWCITLAGQQKMIGECTFWNFDAAFQCAELGYELHPAFWRQGLMAEALYSVLDYGFNSLGLHRIEACPYAGNEPSRALLLKLGFQYEGNLRQRHFFRAQFLDQLYFGLLKEEWQKLV